MAADEGTSGRRKRRPVGPQAGAPLAALLFDRAARPDLAAVIALAQATAAFAVTHDDAATGFAELMCDGLAFDCRGFAPGASLALDTGLAQVALPDDFVPTDRALVTLAPGPQLAGAGQLLPVVRILSGLVLALAELRALHAVAWLPARLAMSPAWFAQGVGPWLKGGPFPALALTTLVRGEHSLTSGGLGYFIGQEFVLTGKNGVLRQSDAHGAVRLTDWLVTHGRVDSTCEVELVGFGTVRIEPDGQNQLRVRTL